MKLAKRPMMKKLITIVMSGSLLCLTACSQTPDSDELKRDVSVNATTSLSIALAYLQLGNVKKAEPNLKRALEEQPNSGAVYLGYALYYQQLGEYEKAEASFVQAKRYSPSNGAPQDFATYLCRKGEYESAVSHYTSTVSVAGDGIKKSLLISLGECYYIQEKWAEAASAFEESLSVPIPDNDKALLRLADIALRDNNAKKALTYLEQFNQSKTQVTADSLSLEAKIYQRLGLESKLSHTVDMLQTLFPNHESTALYQTAQKTDIEEVPEKQEVIIAKQKPVEDVPSEPESLNDNQPTEQQPKFHIIKKGETLYRITRMYAVTLEQLAEWNPTLKADDISIGTKILISAP